MTGNSVAIFSVGNIEEAEIREDANEVLHLSTGFLRGEGTALEMGKQVAGLCLQIGTDYILLGFIDEVDALRDGVVNETLFDKALCNHDSLNLFSANVVTAGRLGKDTKKPGTTG